VSERTFLIFMANGDRHTVKADTFNGGSGEVSLMSGDSLAGYFNGVTAVVVESAPSAQVAGGGLDKLGEPGQLVSFDAGPKIEIGALNITCGAADIAASVGQAMQALMGARERSTPD
jgi:hypothetical protein